MTRWYITGEGKRRDEKILTRYNQDGTIHSVASGFCDGKVYRLYPTDSLFSIKARIVISVHLVTYGSFKEK